MNIFRTTFLSALFLLVNTYIVAQEDKSSAWIFLTHQQEISENLSVLADLQLRTAANHHYINAFLLRSAASLKLTKSTSLAIGYAYLGKWDQQQAERNTSNEHRIYEQYQWQKKLKRKELSLRARLEQRFMKEESTLFAQRARIFASIIYPLIVNADFSKGLYAKVQDEVFLNIQNKNVVNGSILDQHRPFIGLGFRASEKLDIDLGYMYWLQREFSADNYKNVFQLTLNTNF